MKKTILFFIATIFTLSSFGQSWAQLVKLEASDQKIDDNLGSSVAISGDYAIAGASREGSFGFPPNDAGAAYIFHFNSSTGLWTQVAKLVAADREASDFFGISVDISGTYAVIGAVQEDGARGAAYVFEKNDSDVWVQVAKLTAPTTRANDRFGVSVAIDGSAIVVGAEHEDEDVSEGATAQNAGSAYVFTRSGEGVWSFSQKIVASDREANNSFGNSVGIDGSKIIVGAYRAENDSFVEVGAAYVFTLSSGSWTETKKLTSSFITTADRFGWSVGVSGSNYIVGATYYDLDDSDADFKNNAGAAFFFDESNAWAEDRVVGGDRNAQDNLGIDVAISGTRAVIGAHLQNFGVNGGGPHLSDAGAAYVYEKDGSGVWNQTQKLLTNDRFAGDKFGYSVDLTSDTIIGGAVEDNSTSSGIASTGALYIFNDATLSVDGPKRELSLRLFPNPVERDFTIDLRKNYAEVTMWVFNMIGQTIKQKTFTNINTLESNINGPAGIYFVKIVTPDSEQVLKVVKR